VDALEEIVGPDGDTIVLTGEYPQERQLASDFAAPAREKKRALAAAPGRVQRDRSKDFLDEPGWRVAYQKELEPVSLNESMKMDRFNPDASWKPVQIE
jgi:hypothetical protein